jgi:hypothetical protein
MLFVDLGCWHSLHRDVVHRAAIVGRVLPVPAHRRQSALSASVLHDHEFHVIDRVCSQERDFGLEGLQALANACPKLQSLTLVGCYQVRQLCVCVFVSRQNIHPSSCLIAGLRCGVAWLGPKLPRHALAQPLRLHAR